MEKFDILIAIDGNELVWVADAYNDSLEKAIIYAIDCVLEYEECESATYVGHRHYVADIESREWKQVA